MKVESERSCLLDSIGETFNFENVHIVHTILAQMFRTHMKYVLQAERIANHFLCLGLCVSVLYLVFFLNYVASLSTFSQICFMKI